MSERSKPAIENSVAHIGKFPPLDSSTFAPQIIWLALTFGVLYVLMRRLFLPRVSAILDERRDSIERDLATTERLKTASQEAIAKYEQALAHARTTASDFAKKAREQLAADTHAERTRVEAQIAAMVAEADSRIASAKSQALAGVDEMASDVAGAIVARLIGKTVPIDEVKRAVMRRAAE